MGNKKLKSFPVAVSDLASGVIDPILRRRAGINIELVQSWAEIVGERLSETTRPQKIIWQRRLSDDDPFEPATLVIACNGSAALHVQHQTTEIISRINSFLGFTAIGRVRIVQKAIAPLTEQRRPPQRQLTRDESEKLSFLTQEIENEGLRDSLKRLGASVMTSGKKSSQRLDE